MFQQELGRRSRRRPHGKTGSTSKPKWTLTKGLLSRLAPGFRQRLADDGIDAFGWYMMAFQGNAVGGIDKTFEATGLNDFGLNFDFEKLCCAGRFVGAHFRLLGLGAEPD